MKILLLLLSLLSSTLTFALPKNESIMCSPDQMIEISGINCCTTNISTELCHSLIDNFIPDEIITRTIEVKNTILEGNTFSSGAVPNCHWNAVSFIKPNYFETPELLSAAKYISILENNFQRIDPEDAQYGDLILFHEFAKERFFMEDEFGSITGVWIDTDMPSHSAIYLRDGFLFQKENAHTSVFTIDTISNVHRIYTKEAGSKPAMKRDVRLEIRYYRAK